MHASSLNSAKLRKWGEMALKNAVFSDPDLEFLREREKSYQFLS